MQRGFLDIKKYKKFNELEYYDIISCHLLEEPGNVIDDTFVSDYINKTTWNKSIRCPFTNKEKSEVTFKINKKYMNLLKKDNNYQKLLKKQKAEDKIEMENKIKKEKEIKNFLYNIRDEFESNIKSDNIYLKYIANIKKINIAFYKNQGISMSDCYIIINLLNNEDFKIIYDNNEYNLYYKFNSYQGFYVLDIELYKKCCSNWRRCIN